MTLTQPAKREGLKSGKAKLTQNDFGFQGLFLGGRQRPKAKPKMVVAWIRRQGFPAGWEILRWPKNMNVGPHSVPSIWIGLVKESDLSD